MRRSSSALACGRPFIPAMQAFKPLGEPFSSPGEKAGMRILPNDVSRFEPLDLMEVQRAGGRIAAVVAALPRRP